MEQETDQILARACRLVHNVMEYGPGNWAALAVTDILEVVQWVISHGLLVDMGGAARMYLEMAWRRFCSCLVVCVWD